MLSKIFVYPGNKTSEQSEPNVAPGDNQSIYKFFIYVTRTQCNISFKKSKRNKKKENETFNSYFEE